MTVSASSPAQLHASILTELTSRGVVRSRNAPAGDLAELLVQIAYGGELADRSVKSWDVRTAEGRLLQVKCRVLRAEDRSTHFFSPFRSWAFDAAVFVVLDAETYEVVRATELPVDIARQAGRYSEWVKGTQIRANRPLLDLPGAQDVTARVQRVLETLA